MARKRTRTKRYNLVLPEELYDEVRLLADRSGTSVVELLRRFIKLGLIAAQIQNDPESALIIRDGKSETKVLLI